jgi:hypothetical protein
MASRFCDDCVIYYPPNEQKCLVCGQPNTYSGQFSPDNDWRVKVDQALGVFVALPAVDWGHIVRQDGGDRASWWIADDRLSGAGYDHRYIGMVFRVSGLTEEPMFFEIDGKAVRLKDQPKDSPLVKGWWVNRVLTDDWVPDAIPTEA